MNNEFVILSSARQVPYEILRRAQERSKQEWILSWELRTKLYLSIFHPIVEDHLWEPWNREVIKGNVNHIKNLELFYLEATTIFIAPESQGNMYPGLIDFVEDTLFLVEILCTPRKSGKTYEEEPESHPFILFDEARYNRWQDRWQLATIGLEDTSRLRTTWKDYIFGLCDAIFGVWPGHSLFHKGIDLYRGPDVFPDKTNPIGFRADSLRYLSLFFTDENNNVPTVRGADYYLLDAAFIESNGPFTFKKTDRLDRHLIITESNEILFYPNWKRWLFLAQHNVLYAAQYHNRHGFDTSFDMLLNSGRWRKGDIHYAMPIIRINSDILVITVLCFYQQVLKKAREGREKLRSQAWLRILKQALNRWVLWRKTSQDIGHNVGVTLAASEALEYVTEFTGSTFEEMENLGIYLHPFKERQYNLIEKLKSWKPKTVWELRYPGYGGVDPVGLYAFYFAGFIGIFTVLGFALSILQTVAAFTNTSYRITSVVS